MVSDRLKKFIFDKLYKELSHLEIIPYENSLFFIDRKEKYWYLELENNGTLYWRFGFFSEFFQPFSMESPEYVKIISDWVEEVLNHKVSATSINSSRQLFPVEEVLNHKVSATEGTEVFYIKKVEEVLNHKVSATGVRNLENKISVEEVLNHKVLTATEMDNLSSHWMDNILNQN